MCVCARALQLLHKVLQAVLKDRRRRRAQGPKNSVPQVLRAVQMVLDLRQGQVEALLDLVMLLFPPKGIQAHEPEELRGPVALASDMERVLGEKLAHRQALSMFSDAIACP